jgi:hypothetical protein
MLPASRHRSRLSESVHESGSSARGRIFGDQHYAAVFTFFRLNSDDTFAGTQRITEDIELSQDADSLTSTGTAETFDATSTLTSKFCNAAVATRAQ